MAALLYMVIERFTEGPDPVYRRAADQGRLLPEALFDWTARSSDLGSA